MKTNLYRISVALVICIILFVSDMSEAQLSGKIFYEISATALGADSDKPVTNKLASWGLTVEVFCTAIDRSDNYEKLFLIKQLFSSPRFTRG